jgi:hypothetical protein
MQLGPKLQTSPSALRGVHRCTVFGTMAKRTGSPKCLPGSPKLLASFLASCCQMASSMIPERKQRPRNRKLMSRPRPSGPHRSLRH